MVRPGLCIDGLGVGEGEGEGGGGEGGRSQVLLHTEPLYQCVYEFYRI